MACEAVAVHDPSVEVTVFLPVDVKVLVALVVEFPPDHTQEEPVPPAVSETVPQAVVAPEILRVGLAFTTIALDAVAVQPLLVAVTV